MSLQVRDLLRFRMLPFSVQDTKQ